MTLELIVLLAVLGGAVVLFVTELLPVDLVALIVLASLLLTGVVSPEQAFAGFSNRATVTIAAMFVLSTALYRTGMLDQLGDVLARLAERSFWLALAGMMLVISAVSAFINNTAAVAIFLPIVLGAARDTGMSASRLLMPLSFAAIFGGLCTLIGTSTNILVSAIAADAGLRPFGMFEFAPLGLVLLLVGTGYMLAVGVRLIPERRPPREGLTRSFRMDEYVTELVLLPESTSVGQPLGESELMGDLDLEPLEVRRDDRRLAPPDTEVVLAAGDVLRVRCDLGTLAELSQREGVRLRPRAEWRDEDFASEEEVLVEVVVAPNSDLEGRTLAEANFRERYDATVLALRHRGALVHHGIGDARLRPGDALLVEARQDRLPGLKRDDAFVVVSEVETPSFRAEKFVPALAVMVGVVVLPTLGIVPIVASATAGAILMILLRCLTVEEAYEAIEWKVIFLLAGVLTLGTAMRETGGADLLSTFLVERVGPWGGTAVVAAFYLVTSLATELMSNNASAALLAPIAVAAAGGLGVDPRPLLMAVTFAASASFLTPVGYQTNTMVFSAGHYRFTDFARVGAPLNLLFWGTATLLIPVIWPL